MREILNLYQALKPWVFWGSAVIFNILCILYPFLQHKVKNELVLELIKVSPLLMAGAGATLILLSHRIRATVLRPDADFRKARVTFILMSFLGLFAAITVVMRNTFFLMAIICLFVVIVALKNR